MIDADAFSANCLLQGIPYSGLTLPPAGNDFVQICLGNFFGCGLRSTGFVSCWGLNTAGSTVPTNVQMASITCGYAYACGVKLDQSITCWVLFLPCLLACCLLPHIWLLLLVQGTNTYNAHQPLPVLALKSLSHGCEP